MWTDVKCSRLSEYLKEEVTPLGSNMVTSDSPAHSAAVLLGQINQAPSQ